MEPPASITFDDSLWPLLLSRFEGAASDEQYEEYLARGTDYLLRGDRYVSVLDMVRLSVPTASQRHRQAEWLKRNEALLGQRFMGCALVITSPFVRVALSTVLHLRPLPSPYTVAANLGQGVTWATNLLEKEGFTEAAERIRLQVPHHPPFPRLG